MGSKVPSECIFRYAFKDAFLHPEDLSQFCCTGSKSHIATGLRCPYAIIGFCRLKLFFILRACYAVSWVFCRVNFNRKFVASLRLCGELLCSDPTTEAQRNRGYISAGPTHIIPRRATYSLSIPSSSPTFRPCPEEAIILRTKSPFLMPASGISSSAILLSRI